MNGFVHIRLFLVLVAVLVLGGCMYTVTVPSENYRNQKQYEAKEGVVPVAIWLDYTEMPDHFVKTEFRRIDPSNGKVSSDSSFDASVRFSIIKDNGYSYQSGGRFLPIFHNRVMIYLLEPGTYAMTHIYRRPPRAGYEHTYGTSFIRKTMTITVEQNQPVFFGRLKAKTNPPEDMKAHYQRRGLSIYYVHEEMALKDIQFELDQFGLPIDQMKTANPVIRDISCETFVKKELIQCKY